MLLTRAILGAKIVSFPLKPDIQRYRRRVTRILLVAPTCDGTDVGEAWVAHQWASRLGRRHDVTLLTSQKRDRPPAAPQLPGVRVIEWPEPPGLGRAERLNSLLKPGYAAFHLRARRWTRAALARGERFDVAHQPAPVATRYPSPLAGLGIPWLLGPVGGGLADPPGFPADDTAPWYVGLRAVDRWRLAHDPWLRRTYRDASMVLGIAPYVADHLADAPVRELVTLNETALPELPRLEPRLPHGGPLRLLHVGRLVRTKGARDVVRALGLLPHGRARLDVVGDGPDREACEALARELGVAQHVTFHGRQDRASVEAHYRAADVFVFPSYREPGGNVVLEAMGHGLPVVVVDRGGPASAVDDACAIRLPVTTPAALAADVAAAIECLASDPALRATMGRAARLRMEHVGLWEAKIDTAELLYARVVRTAAAQEGGS